jgi:hypothetical protein
VRDKYKKLTVSEWNAGSKKGRESKYGILRGTICNIILYMQSNWHFSRNVDLKIVITFIIIWGNC